MAFRDISDRLRLRELEASRARIVQATDEARRRIERDLHDGAQRQFVAVAMRLETPGACSRSRPMTPRGLLLAIAFTIWIGSDSALVSGLGGGLVVGLGFALVSRLRSVPSQPGADDASPLLPRASWRRDRAFAGMPGLVAGVVFWLGSGVVFAIAVGIEWNALSDLSNEFAGHL